ncbi:hypothetical protein PIB30_065713 [Stylosanthes scabra]|uniref:WAT1-related protein n=1 Tax=Stylosanthes scabra TaxID=79078 RepID=A0ABU6XME6_9FABA|nr:hypothetical protein [Stylosanthes scabra]
MCLPSTTWFQASLWGSSREGQGVWNFDWNWWGYGLDLLKNNPSSQHHHSNDLLGVVCAIASCFSYASWLIIQAKMTKEYPSHNSSTALMLTAAAAIQATVFAFCSERDLSQWKLGAVMIVCGLFAVLWGKNKEMKKVAQLVPSEIIQQQQQEDQAIQVVVTSTPVVINHDKCDQQQ